MKENKLDHYRSKTRAKAGEANGQLIFALLHHDIFQFGNNEDIAKFSEWIHKHEEVELIENPELGFRVGIKYKKPKHLEVVIRKRKHEDD
jgi:hypothetical protein